MKFNKWTLGLAAVGVVSFASVAQAAEERGLDAVSAWTKGVTISGYVDTSVDWTASPHQTTSGGFGAFQGGGSQLLGQDFSYNKSRSTMPGSKSGNNTKADGFNLNVVKLTIEKAPGQEDWASGFKVDLLYGPDAAGFNTSANAAGGQQDDSIHRDQLTADFAIKQAYVALRTPVGNGIDWKIGVFDTIIGYETFESGNNPNFTRSFGYQLKPTEHTGILASYRVCDSLAISAGVANTLMAGINARNDDGSGRIDTYWDKTWMASVALTAPQDWGWAAGSTLDAGIVYGFNNSFAGGKNQVNYYVGGTLKTPVAGVTVGAAFDLADRVLGINGNTTWVAAGYVSWQASDKLSVNGRFDYAKNRITHVGTFGEGYSVTGTLQYNLWANVISRLEGRLDHENGVASNDGNIFSLYANFIYKF